MKARLRIHSGRQGGYAMIVVLGVLALLVVYLVTVSSSIGMSRLAARRGQERMARTQAVAAVLGAARQAAVETTTTLTVRLPDGTVPVVVAAPVPAGHPLWTALPALRPLPGDRLVAVTLSGERRMSRYLINRSGLRRGALLIQTEKAP